MLASNLGAGSRADGRLITTVRRLARHPALGTALALAACDGGRRGHAGLAAEGCVGGRAVPGGRFHRYHRAHAGGPAQRELGQPFVVDNRPGATGAIGATMVKRAPADGYTIMVASIGVYAVNPFLQKHLAYDPAKDFDLLTVAVRAQCAGRTHGLSAGNVRDLVAYMKKNPGKVAFATSGAGSSDHLTAALFWQMSGTSGLHVPYKGRTGHL